MRIECLSKFLLPLLLLVSVNSFAQKRKVTNLPRLDKVPYHFGVQLGFTSSSFFIDRKADFSFSDSLLSVNPISVPAFSLTMLFSLDLNKNIHLRTGIVLAFQDRNIDYSFWVNDTIEDFKKKVHSVYTEVPLLLKLRTDRINNYAVYALGGLKYGYDWASQREVNESFNFKDVVKISKHNFAYCIGGGFDFFLPYFKFGIDLRLDIGLNNVIIKNDTFFSNPIEKMRTRMLQLSVTLEY